MVRFDYRGHGSSGGCFAELGIADWLEDTLTVLDCVTEGPQILVGSSMGGWLAVLAALARPDRVVGLVTVAAAPDFTRELLPDRLGPALWARLRTEGQATVASAYDPVPTLYTRRLVEQGDAASVLDRVLPLRCPVRLLHGTADADVPWSLSLRLMDRIDSADARLTLVKDGDHRLSRPGDLDLLCATLDEIITTISGRVGLPTSTAADG